jgi:cation diffusion facilitator family transporter
MATEMPSSQCAYSVDHEIAGRNPKIGGRAYARPPIFGNSFDFREVLILYNQHWRTLLKSRSYLKRFAWLSIGAAIITIALKTAAYYLTGSVGLLSDALESFVNLAGAIIALAMLTIASRPEDEGHDFGHSKAEYFSSGAEGSFIIIAAGGIAYSAIERLFNPQPLEHLGIGLVVSAIAGVVNLAAALVIGYNGRKHHSITLTANSRHLMTDVLTSLGVLAGVGLVAITGWGALDSLVAIAVAINIVWSGIGILRHSVSGLMDSALPDDELKLVREKIEEILPKGTTYHALMTRQAGARRFVSFHVLVPGKWTVDHGHILLEKLEVQLTQLLPNMVVFTHIEPLDDPASWKDQTLDHHQDDILEGELTSFEE